MRKVSSSETGTLTELEQWVQSRLRYHQKEMQERIVERVAAVLIPRAYFLKYTDENGEVSAYPIPKWTLRKGTTWGDLFALELPYNLTLILDSCFSKDSVFMLPCKNPKETIRLASATPTPRMDSLQFLAAKAMVKAWDEYDEETQQLICDTTCLQLK